MTLNELFEKYRSNPCESLLSEVLRESQFLVYGIVINIVKHNQDAEDLTQDVLIKVIQNINDLPKNTYFIPWLNRISLNAAIDLYQQKKRNKAAIPHLSNFQETKKNNTSTDNDETISILYQHLSKLDDTDQSMIINKHIHQMTYAQLGILYQLPISTIQTKLETTLKRLKASIEKAGFARVSLGITSTLEHLIKPNAALDLVSKVKMHLPSSYPKPSAELLSSKVSIKAVKSAIQGKILNIVIGVVLLISLTGFYFLYEVLSKDETPRNEKKIIAKNILDNKTENNSNIVATKLQKIENTTPKGNSVIVDQTLFSPITKAEKPQSVGEVLSTVKEKIEIEITLIDGDQNNVLAEYEVEFSYNFGFGNNITEKAKTDKYGKFAFSFSEAEILDLKIFTKDYATNSKGIHLTKGKNKYKARLYKGGSIEIRATSSDNNIISGFVAHPVSFYVESLTFDEARGLYVISNLPIGMHTIFFKADGYQETPQYKIRVEPQNVSYIEIKLLKPRIIIIDLNIKNKPDSILISDDLSIIEPYYMKSSSYWKSIKSKVAARAQIFKNQNGLYEYELGNINGKNIAIYIENYAPQVVRLLPHKNNYTLTMVEGLSAQLLVNNESGKAINGASVTYFEDKFKQIAVTNEAGVALLTGINKKTNLNFNISHKDYMEHNEIWTIEEEGQYEKACILNEAKSISGKIKYEGKAVMGASILLVPNFKKEGLSAEGLFFESDANGNYCFNNSDDKKNKEFFIKAFHPDFGAAVSPVIKFESKNQNLDLVLIPEKKMLLKLVDSKGKPLINKSITIRRTFTSNKPNINITTDENGTHELLNLIHGSYNAILNDQNLKIKNETFQIPIDTVVLIAEPEKNVPVKLLVSTPNKSVFSGNLKLWVLGRCFEIPRSEDGNYYLEPKYLGISSAAFEADGYGLVAMGPDLKKENLTNGLIINFNKGETIRVKVLDDRDNSPLSFVSVNISIGKFLDTNIGTMPTNERGEVLFTHLSGKFILEIDAINYAPYRCEFVAEETKDIIVKLVIGGGLKGQLTLDENTTSANAVLSSKNSYYSVIIAADGKFEFVNIPPGEYKFRADQFQKKNLIKDNGQNLKIKQINIIIENDKITEINLDEAIKK